jgi:3-phenylpropionate/trans-cinnamate dioxygenase ferredoxin subunit
MIMGEDVYCPKHGSRFDIRTGAVRDLPATRPVKTYEVMVEDGVVYVKV